MYKQTELLGDSVKKIYAWLKNFVLKDMEWALDNLFWKRKLKPFAKMQLYSNNAKMPCLFVNRFMQCIPLIVNTQLL